MPGRAHDEGGDTVTETQYERWKDFALRMARNGWEHITEARRGKIEEEVRSFFYQLQDDWKKMVDWDESEDRELCCGDWFSEFLQSVEGYWQLSERRMENWRFEAQLHSCIRAGLDLASAPSAGVVGFTLGDLRRMYPEGLPDWVCEGYEKDLRSGPDDAGVWL